jgi:hypothetical protein
MFFWFDPIFITRCSTAGDLTIPQLSRYSRTARTLWHADQSDGTPLHCSQVFDVAWKATSSKRSGSSFCAVERPGKKWPSLLVSDNTAQHVNRKAILEVSCSETVRITDRPQQIIDERRTEQSNKSVQLRVKTVLLLLFSFCHIL